MVSVSIFPPRDLSQEGPTVVSGSVSGLTEKHSRTANPPVTLRSCDGLVQGKTTILGDVQFDVIIFGAYADVTYEQTLFSLSNGSSKHFG